MAEYLTPTFGYNSEKYSEALVNYESEVEKYMHSFADYLFKIDETEAQETQEIK